MKAALKAALIILGWLVAYDIVGVVACFLMDVSPFIYGSAALPFAIWGVNGVFCGVTIVFSAVEAAFKDGGSSWIDLPDAPRKVGFILAVAVVLMIGLSLLFNHLMWRFQPSGELFVPDTESLTLTYFGGVLALLTFVCFTCGPIQKKAKR